MLSPVDLRSELSSWLWERQVFETRENETVVLVSRPVEATPRTAARRGWFTAAATIAIAALVAYAVFAFEIGAWRGGGTAPFAADHSASAATADEGTPQPAAAAIGGDVPGAEASESGPIARAFSLARARIAEAVLASPTRVDGGSDPSP